MHGLKSGSCRFWQRTDLPPGSKVVRADFGIGLICPRAQTCMDSKVVRVDFGIGLIYPRAQTCCASPTQTPARLANSPGFKSFRCPSERIKFSLERFSDQSAAHGSESNSRSNVFQISPLPTVANQILARTFFRSVRCPRERIKFSLERCPDPSRISLRPQPLESSLGRVPQAADGTCNKISKTRSCRSPRTV